METSIRCTCPQREWKHVLSFNLFVNICFGKLRRLLESAFLSEIILQLDAWAGMLARQGKDYLFLKFCDRIDVKPKKDMFLLRRHCCRVSNSPHISSACYVVDLS